MPLKRDSKGRIIQTSGGDFDAPTVKGGGGGQGGDDFDLPTVAAGDARTESADTTHTSDMNDLDPATRISTRDVADKSGQASEDDPVTGWLVVIKGPGRGTALRVGFGRNAVGRGSDNRINLDFGDAEISRNAHCAITFDSRSGEFYLTHGEGANLTYMAAHGGAEEAPVLQPVKIETDARITVGETTLRFVPFCDNFFSWQDSE